MPFVPLAVAAALVEFGVPMWLSIAAVNVAAATALSVGLSYASQALMRTQNGVGSDSSNLAGINSPEVRGSIKQDIPPHRILIGETRCGGVFFFYEKIPPFLYVGYIHSVLPITEVRKAFIATQELTFHSLPDGEIIAPLPIVGLPAFHNRVEVCFQFGALDQPVNPLIARDFPDRVPGFRLPGMANSVWKFHYGSNFDEFESLYGRVQIPDAQIIARGVPLPDPRQPQHILDFNPRDMTALYAAIESWGATPFNNNATLSQVFWAAMPFGLNAGPAAVYQGFKVPVLKTSADFDDEAVPLKGTTEVQKRHTVDGILTLDEKPLSIFEAMLTCNGGFCSPRAGKVLISSSQPRTPVATITDADILGGFRYRDAKPKRERLNTPRARFISPENEYQDTETQWPSQAEIDALIAADGEPFEQTLRLGLVTTHQRAQRRLKAFTLETNLGRTMGCLCDSRLLGAVEGDVLRVSLRHYPAANGLYSIEDWQLQDDTEGMAFSLVEYDPSIPRDWTPDTDEQPLVLEPDEEDE